MYLYVIYEYYFMAINIMCNVINSFVRDTELKLQLYTWYFRYLTEVILKQSFKTLIKKYVDVGNTCHYSPHIKLQPSSFLSLSVRNRDQWNCRYTLCRRHSFSNPAPLSYQNHIYPHHKYIPYPRGNNPPAWFVGALGYTQ